VILPLYQVDAFTSRTFGGNPAAVCPLEHWLDDERMQAIAAENNVAETAFFVGNGNGYDLRWMTPKCEVDLCGHATLASAYIIFRFFEPDSHSVSFQTKSGELIVRRDGDLLTLDFPARPPERLELLPELTDALGSAPAELWSARDYMAVYPAEDEVRRLAPDMARIAALDRFAVIVTAPGTGDTDFVSRFFAPAKGIPEDPVTGSAHCTLVPYWAQRLGKPKLHAKQISERQGELFCEDRGTRVWISGRAVLFFEGRLHL
jgi:PhzF family phenazine biosynthesis protein